MSDFKRSEKAESRLKRSVNPDKLGRQKVNKSKRLRVMRPPRREELQSKKHALSKVEGLEVKSWSVATVPTPTIVGGEKSGLVDKNSPLIKPVPTLTVVGEGDKGRCLHGIISLFIILFVGSAFNPVHAQQSVTQHYTPQNLPLEGTGQAFWAETSYPELQQYIQIAIRQNPELQSLRSMVDADRERVREAGLLMDPEISVAYDFNPMMSDSYLGRFSISAMQMFPWFGSLDARRELQQSSAEASRAQVSARQLEILRDLKIIWLDIAELREQIRITEETIEFVQDLEKMVEVRYETGRAGQAELLRIQMEEQRLHNRIANLEDRLNPFKARFNELLNRDADADVDTADELHSRPLLTSEEEIRSLILQQHPQFDLISAERTAAGQQLRLAKLDGRPSFGIGLEVMGRDFGPMSMFPDAKESIIGMAVVRVPLFRSRYDSQKRQANFRLNALDHQQELAENSLLAELEEVSEEIRSAERSLIMFDDELVPRARQALTIMSEEYATGTIRFDELLQLHRELLDLEFERIETVVKQNKAVAKIESLMGVTSPS